MHTDDTLKILDTTTISIGAEFRAFTTKTCPSFNTQELKREADARKRRQKKKAEERSASKDQPLTASFTTDQSQDKPREKQFSLQSYKYHVLGDYGDMIRQYGTSDSFSTEPVSNDSSNKICLKYIFYLFRAS